jgi:hypothetical protein
MGRMIMTLFNESTSNLPIPGTNEKPLPPNLKSRSTHSSEGFSDIEINAAGGQPPAIIHANIGAILFVHIYS